MTMRNEEVNALKRTREFMRDILHNARMPQIALKDRAYSCLKHYPPDYAIEARWPDVCHICNTDKVFCRCALEDDMGTEAGNVQDSEHSDAERSQS